MSFHPIFSNISVVTIDMEVTITVVNTEEYLLIVLAVPIQINLLTDGSAETPEYPVPGAQPIGRVGKVQIMVLWRGEIFWSVAEGHRYCFLYYLIVDIEI